MQPVWEQAAGVLVMLAILADVFLTVLYARAGTGVLSHHLGELTWKMFRSLPTGRHQPVVLSFCGPIILVLTVLTWAIALTLGAGLIAHPELGSGIRSGSGDTPGDFITAVYAGGSSLSIVGSGNFVPNTAAMKVFFLVNALIGTSVISLTLTYLMQVYGALLQRNAAGLTIHLLSGETGDAAELIAGLFPDGELSAGYSSLSEAAGQLTQIKEAHHFYPVLFYFRFREPYYSVSRSVLLALDTVSLIECAFDDRKAGWIKRSAGLREMRTASLMLVLTLEKTFLGREPQRICCGDTLQNCDAWRARYYRALSRLAHAGVPVREDEATGARMYLEARSGWDRLIPPLAAAMAYSMEDVDPAGQTNEILAAEPQHARPLN